MGGVFASWALQAHITVGEPDALLGFLGPKVYAALTGEEFPAGIQTAEHLHDHGILDAVLERSAFRDYAARFLRLWDLGRRTAQCPLPLSSAATTDPGGTPPTMSANAWSAVEKTRESSRPGVSELLSSAASEVHLLSPAGPPRSAGTIRTALANFGGLPAVLVGTDRRLAATGASLSTGAFAAARRAMDLAENLRLPLVTVIDTAGAELSAQAEEDGIAREISRTLSRMLELRTPTVAVLLGEGTGGGALALFPADRVIAASSAWLAPLPPEGASAIRYGDTAHAAEIATSQRVSAACMLEDGLVDETFPEEPHDRGGSPEFLEHLGHGIAIALADTAQLSAEIRLRRRELKYSEPGTA